MSENKYYTDGTDLPKEHLLPRKEWEQMIRDEIAQVDPRFGIKVGTADVDPHFGIISAGSVLDPGFYQIDDRSVINPIIIHISDTTN